MLIVMQKSLTAAEGQRYAASPWWGRHRKLLYCLHSALPTGTSNIYDEAISFMTIATDFIENQFA